jgi:hypothetical protein
MTCSPGIAHRDNPCKKFDLGGLSATSIVALKQYDAGVLSTTSIVALKQYDVGFWF